MTLQLQPRVAGWAIAVLALCAPPLWAAKVQDRSDDSAFWCGTHDWGIEEALARREWNLRRLNRDHAPSSQLRAQAIRTGPRVRQEGNVAVIEDDGTIVADENLFDYQSQSLSFLRKRKIGFKVKTLSGSLDANLGDKLTIDDDDTVRVDLAGFKFPFFAKRYSSVYINSDGNITLGEGESASSARDIQRLLNGPPRIAAFFNDLDPARATGDGGIYVRVAGKKLIVTWWQVPEFDTQNRNTFQLILFAKGTIEVRFDAMDAGSGIVGVAPGGGSGLELIDLSRDLPITRKRVAIAERFSEDETLDESAVAGFFYENFADDYDQLVMFTDFGQRASEDAFAYHLTVKNEVKGIGSARYDGSRFFGSRGRLGGFVNMGGMSQYSSNLQSISFLRVYSGLDILAHELGHQWLVHATFVDADGQLSEDLLGRGNAHWNFYFDSDLSFLEGNDIVDNGDGTFTTQAPRASFNPLDLYLMGLIAATKVPDMFYVANPDEPDLATSLPASPGMTFIGNRVDVTMEQILASLGKRKPSVGEAPTQFNVAFILLAKKGSRAKNSSIDRVNQFASRIPQLFASSTGGRATLHTTLAAR